MILCHHCHLVVRTCNISQTPAIQQSAFFSFLFFSLPSHNMSYSDLTLCNHRLSSNVLLGFLFRFLVSASLKTWSVMSKLLKPTGDSRGEVEGGSRAPHSHTRSTQHTNSPIQPWMESHEHSTQSTLPLNSAAHKLSHSQTRRVYSPVLQWHQSGEEKIPHANQTVNILFTTQLGF